MGKKLKPTPWGGNYLYIGKPGRTHSPLRPFPMCDMCGGAFSNSSWTVLFIQYLWGEQAHEKKMQLSIQFRNCLFKRIWKGILPGMCPTGGYCGFKGSQHSNKNLVYDGMGCYGISRDGLVVTTFIQFQNGFNIWQINWRDLRWNLRWANITKVHSLLDVTFHSRPFCQNF